MSKRSAATANAFYFRTGQLRFDFTAQDEADIVAFLRLLD